MHTQSGVRFRYISRGGPHEFRNQTGSARGREGASRPFGSLGGSSGVEKLRHNCSAGPSPLARRHAVDRPGQPSGHSADSDSM